MASSLKRKQLHALAIPSPGQGHINPLMRFCKRLASQEGFTITFVDIQPVNSEEHVSTHANTQELSKQQPESTHANTSLSKQEHTHIDADSSAAVVAAETLKKFDIRRVHIPMEMPNLGEGYSMFEAAFEAVESLSPLIEELSSRLIHEDPPITCLISDLYMTGPTQKIADQLNIPRIAFHTTSQSLLLFKNYILEGTISLEEEKFPHSRHVLMRAPHGPERITPICHASFTLLHLEEVLRQQQKLMMFVTMEVDVRFERDGLNNHGDGL